MTNEEKFRRSFTLCWDCKNATGNCSWSQDFIPVEGWLADEQPPNGAKPSTTYTVYSCPKFERDAFDGGARRIKEVSLC